MMSITKAPKPHFFVVLYHVGASCLVDIKATPLFRNQQDILPAKGRLSFIFNLGIFKRGLVKTEPHSLSQARE